MRKIGRVHWLFYHLPNDFKSNYHIRYDYVLHNYCFWRHKGYKLLDCFIVVRTSRKCFRVMYFNNNFKYITYFSSKKSNETALKIYELYKQYDTY